MLAYRIGKYPIAVAQFARFVDGKGYETERYWTLEGWAQRREEGWTKPRYWNDPIWNLPNHPVVGVSWYEAVAYCAWLTATNTGRRFRLPDEAMWEKAARGEKGLRWPWGNTWDATRLNAEQTIGRTSAVGIFPAGQSPYGVFDCAGNVLEWCSGPGVSETPYPFQQRLYEEDLKLTPTFRALRGGAWLNNDRDTRAAYQYNNYTRNRNNYVGFRVVELLSDSGF